MLGASYSEGSPYPKQGCQMAEAVSDQKFYMVNFGLSQFSLKQNLFLLFCSLHLSNPCPLNVKQKYNALKVEREL